MKNLKATKIFKDFQKFTKKRSPEILTGIGIAGMITTVVFSVQATPKAMKLIEEEKMFKEKEAHEGGIFDKEDEKYAFSLTPIETVKAAWKPYVPATITGITSIACIIGANSVHVRRNAAIATAYQLSTAALSDYREKVVETIGEKKETVIRDKVAKKKIEENPVNNSAVLITNKGNTLMYDAYSDRYFRSDIDKIRNAVLTMNEKMVNSNEMYVSLNDFYDEINLKHVEIGDAIGWCISQGKLDVRFSAQITEDNEPCIVIDHLVPPAYGYDAYF